MGLLQEIVMVDKVLCKFKTYSITKTKVSFYAGAVVVRNRLGVKINKAAKRKKTVWRSLNRIKVMRKDITQLQSSNDKEVGNVRHWQKY